MATAYNGRRQYSPLSTPAPNRAGELQQQQQMRYYRSPQPATVGAPIHTVVDDERKTRIRDEYTDDYVDNEITNNYKNTSQKDGSVLVAKYCIFGFNLFFMLIGVAMLALGAWLRTDSRFREFLSERYRLVTEEAFWQAPTLYVFSYIMIILGACMVVVSFFGCCGAVRENTCLLISYFCAIFVLFIASISSGIYLLYKRDGIDVELSDALNYMVQHYYQGAGVIQEALDHLQQTFRCCGNAGCSDFRAFRQDPPRTCDIRCDGCHYRIWLALRIGFTITACIFFAIFICQLLAMSLSAYICWKSRETRRLRRLQQYHDASGYYRNAAFQPSQQKLSTHPEIVSPAYDTIFGRQQRLTPKTSPMPYHQAIRQQSSPYHR